MHYFMLRAFRPGTGSAISILVAVPLFNEYTGKMSTQEEIAQHIYHCAEATRASEVFEGFDITVGEATQEHIDEFEEFLAICGE